MNCSSQNMGTHAVQRRWIFPTSGLQLRGRRGAETRRGRSLSAFRESGFRWDAQAAVASSAPRRNHDPFRPAVRRFVDQGVPESAAPHGRMFIVGPQFGIGRCGIARYAENARRRTVCEAFPKERKCDDRTTDRPPGSGCSRRGNVSAGPRPFLGSNGSITAHCSSLRSNPAMAAAFSGSESET